MPVDQRLCKTCNVVEDELHFLLVCRQYDTERMDLYDRLNIQAMSTSLSKDDLFVFLLSSKDQRHLEIVGEYIYKCFQKRRIFLDNIASNSRS